MPNLEAELMDFAGHTCFPSLNSCNAYGQLPLHPCSANAYGIISPDGVHVSTQELHGLKNPFDHFQSYIPNGFNPIQNGFKLGLDDFVVYSKTEEEVLGHLEAIFRACEEYNFIFSANKCKFFDSTIKWRGVIIDARVINQTHETLKQFDVWNSWWQQPTWFSLYTVVNGCPHLFQHAVLEWNLWIIFWKQQISYLVREKMSILKKITLSKTSWDATHELVFINIQETLEEAAKLAHLKKDHVVSVLTDASKTFCEEFWPKQSRRIAGKKLSLKTTTRWRFLGDPLNITPRNWAPYEEAYAMLKVFEKMEHVLEGLNPAKVFLDHQSLIYLFASFGLRLTCPKYVHWKVPRWAIFLSLFDFVTEHIDRSKNMFANPLTRWSQGYRSTKDMYGTVLALFGVSYQVQTDCMSRSRMKYIRRNRMKNAQQELPKIRKIDFRSNEIFAFLTQQLNENENVNRSSL